MASSKNPYIAKMFGCFMKLCSLISSINWSSISASFNCFLLITLSARMKPESFYSTKNTFPNLPLPNFLPRWKLVILNSYFFFNIWFFCSMLRLKQLNFFTCKFLMLWVFMRDLELLWESRFFVECADPNTLILDSLLFFSLLVLICTAIFYLFSPFSSKEGIDLLVRKGCLWKFLGKWALY